MSFARAKANSIINDYGIDNASILINHLEDLCFDLGAYVQFKPLDGADARIVAKDGKGIITINSNEQMEQYVRFSVGHELGHFLLHCKDIPEFNCSRRDMDSWFANNAAQQKEIEANEFSVELLLPEILVKPIIKKEKVCIETVEKIAAEFKMSISSSVRRYVDLNSEATAVIFYNKDGMTSFNKSKLFDDQKYFIQKGPLDKESLAYDVVAGKNHTNPMSVAATAWLSLPSSLQEETIIEQTRYYPNYNFGFSLLWIKSAKLIRY